jgi:hypothetical protein
VQIQNRKEKDDHDQPPPPPKKRILKGSRKQAGTNIAKPRARATGNKKQQATKSKTKVTALSKKQCNSLFAVPDIFSTPPMGVHQPFDFTWVENSIGMRYGGMFSTLTA